MDRRFGRLLVVVGVVGTLTAAWVAGRAGVALLRDPGAPPGVAPAEAPDGRYVRLEGAVLDCETRAVRDGKTLVLGAGGDGGHPFVAWLIGELRCKDIVLEGSFLPGKFTRDYFLERARVSLPEGEDVRLFTDAPSPRHQRDVLTRAVPWLALSLVLLVVGARGLRARA